MNHADLRAIKWIPWTTPLHHEDEGARNDALGMAESWLSDFGIGLMHDCGTPDAWAKLDAAFAGHSTIESEVRWAFRLDSFHRGKPASVAVIVTIDYDADGTPGGGGWSDRSKCDRVEVERL